VGAIVEVVVWLGARVKVGVGLGVEFIPQATGKQAITNNQKIDFRYLLWGDGEEGVVIIDLPMCNSKGVISISNKTLGRGGCPGHVARASRSVVATQGELAAW
jgi:hypothetical protein